MPFRVVAARLNPVYVPPSMSASLVLLLAVAAAYLAAHVVFEWLAKRFLLVSAAEYLLLGILLGPQVSKILSASLVQSLAPGVTLALGWIGMMAGTRFDLRKLVGVPARRFRIAFGESSLTFVTVAGLEFLVLGRLFSRGSTNAAIVLGALAVASSGVGVGLVSRLLHRRGEVVEQLELSSAINALFAITVLGLVMSVRHVPVPASRPLTATEWMVVTMAIGVVGGTLFHVFLGETQDPDRLFVALVGGIVLVSGAATYLRLSSLTSAMLFGVILVNTSSNPETLIATLERVERPFYFVLLLFGGAAWQPTGYPWAIPVLLYLAARAAGKIGGSRLAARANHEYDELGPDWGRALLGQGRVGLALGLSYLHSEAGSGRTFVFTAAIASILLTEFLSARVARSVVTARTSASDEPAPSSGHEEPDARPTDAVPGEPAQQPGI